MNRRRRGTVGGPLALVVALATLCLSMGAMVVSAAPGNAQIIDLDVVDIEITERDVTLTVVVPDGLRTGQITPASFPILMNGETQLPQIEPILGDELDVILVIDISGSMTPAALAAAKASAVALIDELPPFARVSVVTFGDTAQVVQPFTTSVQSAIARINELVAGGDTALYAGVIQASNQLRSSTASNRTVVLLSDGANTIPEGSLEQAQEALRDSEAVLEAISIETQETNTAELDALATASGGSVTRVDNLDTVQELYAELGADIASQYRLRFQAIGSGATRALIEARTNDGTPYAQALITLGLPIVLQEPTPVPAADIPPTPVPEQLLRDASQPTVLILEPESRQLLKWASIASVGTAIAASVLLLLTPGRGRRRLKPIQRFSLPKRSTTDAAVTRVVGAMTSVVERAIAGGSVGPWLSTLLDTAGWKVRNTEFVLLIGLITLAAFLTGALASVAVGITLAALVLGGVGVILMLLVNRRRDAFNDQLNSTLQMMAGAMRTGYSLPQVFALVAQEAASPTREEFGRVVTETRLGRDLVESARGVADRMRSPDFAWTTAALEISRDVGGDLAEVLDNVAATVRTRARVRRQIMALSAEGRISAWVLIALPFPMFFWQLLVNREYTMLLFNTGLGRMIFFIAVSLLVVGIISMRKLVAIKY